MSDTAAIATTICLMLLALAPLTFAAFVRRAHYPAILFYLLLAGGGLVHQAGIVGGAFEGHTELRSAVSQLAGGECAQLIDAAQRSGIIVDRGNPGRVVVSGSLWNRLPEDARESVAGCLEQARPGGSDQPLEIVERSKLELTARLGLDGAMG